MSRRGNSRAEIFAVQSDCEEESAIETVLTDAEEDWTAVTPEPRRPRIQSRRQKSVLREKHKRRTRDDVPWDHHEKHRHTRAPVGISEKIERRLAEKERMNASRSRGGGRSKSSSRKPAVIYDEDDDDSFLSSYANGGGGGEEETAVTSISQLKRELKRMAKLKSSSEKKTSKTKSKKKKSGTKSKDDKRKKKSKKSGKRRDKKRSDGDAFEQLFKACDTSGGVYGAACKMVDKAFQLDSSSDEGSSSDEDSSDDDEETMAASTAVSSAVTGADNTAITGFTEATSAVPSFDTTKHSGTTATGYTGITGATGFTEETPAPHPRRTPRRKEAVSSKRSPPTSTPTPSRRKPMPTPSTPNKKSGGHRYRQVIAPPGKLGLSLTSSSHGPMVKLVSRHCPVNVKVGDVIARVNGQSVLGMDCKRVMEMFVTLAKREKIIDILPQSGSGGAAPGGTVGKPRAPMATPSRRGKITTGQHRPSPQTMRSKSTPRATASSRSRSRSQMMH